MADFIEFFHKGINSAKIADKNKDEIQSVFDRLNEQLSSESGGRLHIEPTEFSTNSPLEDLSQLLLTQSRETYYVLAVRNPLALDSKANKLATWKMDRNGYPCRIDLDSNRMICEDKAALESNLQLLLSDPIVGDVIYKTMKETSIEETGQINNEDDTTQM